MKKRIAYLTFLVIFYSCNKESKLIWEDNFDGTVLNEQIWNFELGNGCPDNCGWGNNEKEIYTKSNHKIENGYLIITIKKEDSIYTSTRITTKAKKEFQYGRIEARAKLPQGQGLWPAFWMLGSNISEVGWPMSGEIDILEYVGREPKTVYTSLHTQNSHGNTINSKKTFIEDIEQGFHIYAIDWTKDKIDFYVDEKLVYTFAPQEKTTEVWPFDQPFYILINMAIGGNFGGFEIDDTVLPQKFIIDYVRVYKN